MARFLHTADWQIGMTRTFLSAEAQARFTDARLESIRRLGDVAVQQDCHFIVVAGDVFESNQLSPQTIYRAIEVLRDVRVPVFLLPGNHDSLQHGTLYEQEDFLSHLPNHVHVLSQAGPTPVAEGVELIAAPWRGKHPDRDLVAQALALAGPADDTIRIVVGHGSIDALDRSQGHDLQISAVPLEAALADGQIHYVALGDRHSTTSVGSSGSIWYSGASEVTSLREESPGNVLVVDLEAGRSPHVTTHHVGTWAFAERSYDVSSSADVAAVERGLAAMPAKDRTVLWLRLQGTLSLADYTEVVAAVERFEQVFAAIPDWIGRSHLAVLSDEEDLSELGLSGFVARAASEILHQAQEASPTHSSQGAVHDTNEAQDGQDDSLVQGQDVLTWDYEPGEEATPATARDALALLYRLKKEGSR